MHYFQRKQQIKQIKRYKIDHISTKLTFAQFSLAH